VTAAGPDGPVVVTGAGGRLGSALVARLEADGRRVRAWRRPEYDLDDADAAARLVARDRPVLVFHPAAWTDVDGCTREPSVCLRRNAAAVADLAVACRDGGAQLVHVSTNEVFGGGRSDGEGYREDDPTGPINAYGRAKLAAEEAVRERLHDAWIVRTSWLFGPPGNDFPARILAAADRLAPGDPLRVVADEIGCPTYAPDLAAGLVRLVSVAEPGTYHLVNDGAVSRHDWAVAVLRGAGRATPVVPITLAEYPRASTPPRWGVLDTGRAAAVGVHLRPWREALSEYLPALRGMSGPA
jgi:dTDP-4-dehydrorhamnose reductase